MTSTETNQSKNKKRIKFVVFNGIIAALYVVLTYFLAPISYGPVQARVSEVLTIFPIFSAATIPGVALGGFISNIINPENFGPVDIICGTLATVIAGICSYLIGKKNKWLGIIPVILANGLIVGSYLPFFLVDSASEVTVQAILFSMLSVSAGETAVLVVLGLPMVALIKNTGLKNKLP